MIPTSFQKCEEIFGMFQILAGVWEETVPVKMIWACALSLVSTFKSLSGTSQSQKTPEREK